jgi:hypothetical protein
MRLFHGGYVEIIQPEIRVTKNARDFGRGFYCTNIQAQAEKWARRYKTPVVSVYEYTPTAELDILSFSELSEEWLDFIIECRSGRPHTYAIVEGAMANDQVWNYIADFISGILTREQFWVLAKFKYPTHQIAFCQPQALDCLRYIENFEVNP